jgi:hypothetical protein
MFRGRALQSYFEPEFGEFYLQLPPSVQRQADRAFEHFAIDPRYKSLQFKCVDKSEAIYSIRINLNYRALGRMRQDGMHWYWAGDHDNYERKIN